MLGAKVLEEKKSKYNGNLRVVKSFGIGTYIQSDGLTQSGGIVETIWRQTLRFLNRKSLTINQCLILGLGGGTVAKLIRKKYPNAKITGVEIDPIMIELGKKYLDLNSSNVNINLCDAAKYKFQKTKFDLVTLDLYNGDTFPKQFESENYLRLAKSALSNDGVIIFNRLYFGDKRPEAVKFGRKLEKIFEEVEWYYPEANLMFICK